MIGRRWITTLRKLPTSRLRMNTDAIRSAGEVAKASSIVMPRGVYLFSRRPCCSTAQMKTPRTARRFLRLCACWPSDHRAQLEYRQVHCDHETADQCAQDHHDQRLEEARQTVDGGVDVRLVEVRDLARHLVQ